MGRFSSMLSLFFEIKHLLRSLKGVGGCCQKKNKNFSRFLEFDKNHSLRVFGLLIINLGAKNLTDVHVMVYTLIFLKSISSFHLELNYMGFSSMKKLFLTIKIY